MEKENVYKNITYIGIILIFLELIIDFQSPYESEILDLLSEFIWFITFTFAYLWLRKNILLIGWIFYLVDFNISLLYYSILPLNSEEILSETLKNISLGFHIAGFICLTLGIWDLLKIEFLNKESNIGIKQIFLFLVVSTAISQIIMRII